MESPPASVLRAFGAGEPPVALGGGSGTAWRSGDVVLKRLDRPPAQLEWEYVHVPRLRRPGYRLARPLRADDGSLVADGWTAWERVEGRHEPRRWVDTIAAGRRLHTALATLPCPRFVEGNGSPWGIGHRVALDGAEPDFEVKHLDRLRAAIRPLAVERQLIHSDLCGNVLYAEGSDEPAIIDFSPTWGPVEYASAIVVCDALTWEAADERILDAVASVPSFAQLLLRAVVFRAVVDRIFRRDQPLRPDDEDEFAPVVELACTLAQA